MGSQGVQLYSTLSLCLKALFVKGQVPKARDVNKSPGRGRDFPGSPSPAGPYL